MFYSLNEFYLQKTSFSTGLTYQHITKIYFHVDSYMSRLLQYLFQASWKIVYHEE